MLHFETRERIDNLLVLLIGSIPISMLNGFVSYHGYWIPYPSKQGVITKRLTAIEKMAQMDVLYYAKTGTLANNKLSVDRNLIEVFAKGVAKEHMILLAARASGTENQDAIDDAIVEMLTDPKEVLLNSYF